MLGLFETTRMIIPSLSRRVAAFKPLSAGLTKILVPELH